MNNVKVIGIVAFILIVGLICYSLTHRTPDDGSAGLEPEISPASYTRPIHSFPGTTGDAMASPTLEIASVSAPIGTQQ